MQPFFDGASPEIASVLNDAQNAGRALEIWPSWSRPLLFSRWGPFAPSTPCSSRWCCSWSRLAALLGVYGLSRSRAAIAHGRAGAPSAEADRRWSLRSSLHLVFVVAIGHGEAAGRPGGPPETGLRGGIRCKRGAQIRPEHVFNGAVNSCEIVSLVYIMYGNRQLLYKDRYAQ